MCKNNKKLLVVGAGNQRDSRTWSGTSSRLINIFENEGVEIIDYNIMSPIPLWLKKSIRIISHFIYFRIYARSPFLTKLCSNSLENMIKRNNISNLIFISENIEVKNPNINSSIYIDAVLKPLTQYGLYKDQTHKLYYNWFYKRYERNDIKSFQRANQIFTQNEWSRQFLINEYKIDKNKIWAQLGPLWTGRAI